MKSFVYDLPCPPNLSVWWNMGSLLGFCLVVQILTGFLLSCFYTAHEDMAFDSVAFVMREVNSGWLVRNIHVNMASAMFACMYVHIGRGIYYGSYRLYKVWLSGFLLMFLMMLTAFTGYVLPWGQMSYWAAQVITNLVTVIPYVGKDVAEWVWGDYSLGNFTLKRFFSIHFTVPYLILVAVVGHLILLHEGGSGNPLGVDSDSSLVRFHTYYTLKDLCGVMMLSGVVGIFVFFYPNVFVDPTNLIPCNYMKTPMKIHPEWYFLFLYTVLRCVQSKSGGVLLMFSAVLILLALPLFHIGDFEGMAHYTLCQVFFWVWVANWCFMNYMGLCESVSPWVEWGGYSTMFYFGYFFSIPLCQRVDEYLIKTIKIKDSSV
uniref:Cytochrome b n=1 Tax=Spondylus violaceus TaxID=1163653 RepID=A0A515MNS4_9BIVA|nr:cytochrome b [Spondylus violaceus]